MNQEQSSRPLVCPSHATHYIAMLVFGLVLGTGASYFFLKSSGDTYQAGFDAAKKVVEQSNIGAMIRPVDDIRTLSGSVTAVSGDKVTFHTASNNPFDDATLLDRVVIIGGDTKIVRLSQKDPSVMQEEMAAFTKATQTNTGTRATPPSPYNSTTVKVSDIKVGDSITVVAGENIKSMKEFSATGIQIEQSLAVSAPLPVLAPIK